MGQARPTQRREPNVPDGAPRLSSRETGISIARALSPRAGAFCGTEMTCPRDGTRVTSTPDACSGSGRDLANDWAAVTLAGQPYVEFRLFRDLSRRKRR